MIRLVLDLETTSTVDLRKSGAHAYAEHPDTQVTVLCFAIDDGPVRIWTILDVCPLDFHIAIEQGATIVAHNYGFEFQVYHHRLVPLGWPPIPLTQWSCTMARSLVAGYPASLELAGKAAGLAIRKDAGARDLMLRFARPRSLDPLTWWHQTDPVRFKNLCEYCAQDVLAERALDRAVPELSPRERVLFEIDHHLNQRGLGIDHALVSKLAALTREAQDILTQRIFRLTGGRVASPNQVLSLREWLASQGVFIPDLRRATVRAMLADTTLAKAPREALQARLDASRSSTAKLAAIASARSQDGRVRGCFQYYGANRTGRWAGRRVQPQNLFRGSIRDVPGAIHMIQHDASVGDLDGLFEDRAMGVVASCLRSCIVARPGHRLVVADLAQIEARVLAWLAGQHDALEVFRNREDIYTATARAIGSASRQLGKVLVLACGFGMGPEKFQATARGYGLDLGLMECVDLVERWRQMNPAIVQFWWDCERTVKEVTRYAPAASPLRQLQFSRSRDAAPLLIRLPSGRRLVYRQPTIQWNPERAREQFCYMGSLGGNWMQLRAWPGKLAENVTQAVARDVMADAMIQLADLPLIATIHDELIAEVPEAQADQALDRMLAVMQRTPAWASGLPMDAAGFIVRRYQKG